MINVSDVKRSAPEVFKTTLQKSVYETLEALNISYERVDTDEAITMEDCVQINARLDMEMVKTLFLCNRQQTNFYLFITKGDSPFRSKDFSNALNITRVSFAPIEKMEEMLGTKIGAATVFSALLDKGNKVLIVFDQAVVDDEWYGCSDGTTTGYMKVPTEKILHDFLPFVKHTPVVIQI